MKSNTKLRRKKGKNIRAMPIIILLALVVFIAGVFSPFFEWNGPTVLLEKDLSRIGNSAELAFSVSDLKSGIRFVEVYFEQDGKRYDFFHKAFIRKDSYPYAGPHSFEESKNINIKTLSVDEGQATLVINAYDFSFWGWFSGNISSERYPVIIDTRPPVVSVIKGARHLNPGSAGVIVYKSNEPLLRHGVNINGSIHPGHPLSAKGKNIYGAIVAIPYNAKQITISKVYAVDLTGNDGQTPFGIDLQVKSLQTDRINISDGFLNRKIPEFEQYYTDLSGTKVEKYVYINNHIRTVNNKKIKEICGETMSDPQWDGAFLRLSGSERRANFADHRSYYYKGRKIDNQTHLGVDLASIKFAEVQAANNGRVVFADYLGIYGNTVIIDHGMGVFSLYSHLSQTSVKTGDMLEKGRIVGLTGTTGMAGGDHLHYSMLINGVFVDPVQWWDAKWLRFNINNILS